MPWEIWQRLNRWFRWYHIKAKQQTKCMSFIKLLNFLKVSTEIAACNSLCFDWHIWIAWTPCQTVDSIVGVAHHGSGLQITIRSSLYHWTTRLRIRDIVCAWCDDGGADAAGRCDYRCCGRHTGRGRVVRLILVAKTARVHLRPERHIAQMVCRPQYLLTIRHV